MKRILLSCLLLLAGTVAKADLLGGTFPPVTAPTPSIDLSTVATPSSPSVGQLWNDTTQQSIIGEIDATTQTLSTVLFSINTTSTSANSTGEVDMLPSKDLTGNATLPLNFFSVGKILHISLSGFYSTTATPTLTIKVKLGSTVVLSSGAITQSASVTNGYFHLEGDILCQTVGASGTVLAEGDIRQGTGATGTIFYTPIPNTSATTINTTTSQTIDVTATWGTASASNSLTLATGYVQIVN